MWNKLTSPVAHSQGAPRYLTEADVAGLMSFPEAIDALDDAFRAQGRGNASNRVRSRIAIPGGTYNLMAAHLPPTGAVGLKVYISGPATPPMHILLHAADGSGLIAILEAAGISRLRTGAVSGLAARHLAFRAGMPLAIIGAGRHAAAQVAGVLAGSPEISEIRVYSRDSHRRAALVSSLRATYPGLVLVDAKDVRSACTGAGIVVTITNSPSPVLHPADVDAETLVIGAGNNNWRGCEIDPLILGAAARIVVDDINQARVECGELMQAAELGLVRWEAVEPLSDVVCGRGRDTANSSGIRVFESQGIALADVALAARLYELALDREAARLLTGDIPAEGKVQNG
jgi:ornithine cyclodeaminase/alanine dehydrogenase-like protein (mu-crystallin family)